MAITDYNELKNRFVQLTNNLERLDRETASYATTSEELSKLVVQVNKLTQNMNDSLRASEALIEQVNDIAVESTLNRFLEGAQQYSDSLESLSINMREDLSRISKEIDNLLLDLDKRINDLSEQVESGVNKLEERSISLAEHMSSVEANVDKRINDLSDQVESGVNKLEERSISLAEHMTSLEANANKKIYLLGGISILCGIIAIVCAFVI